MQRAIEWVIQSGWRMTFASALVALVVSCLLYWPNWWSYYDSMARVKESHATTYANQLAAIYEPGDNGLDAQVAFRKRAERLLPTFRGVVTLTDSDGWEAHGRPWTLRDGYTLIDNDIDLGSIRAELAGARIRIIETNRLGYWSALWRGAIGFVGDVVQEPDSWFSAGLYKRSLPFWAPFVLIFGVTFLLFRLTARVADAAHATRLAQKRVLDRQLGTLRDTLDGRNARLADAEEMLRQAEERLRGSEFEAGTQDLIDLQNERDAALRERDSLGEDYSAAQELLEEAAKVVAELKKPDEEEARYIGRRIIGITRDMPRIEGWIARLDASAADVTTLKVEDPTFARLRKLLKGWLVQRRPAPEEHWSNHSKAIRVQEAYHKLNTRFIQDCFTSARNGAYAPASRKTIAVRQPTQTSPRWELEIVLDDDAGRTLYLEFQPRQNKGAPEPGRLGFALAVAFRAVNRDFEAFRIR